MLLDKIDKQIIRVLYKDGRQSLTTISKNVVKSDKDIMSHTGIKKRIDKLQNSDILKIQGNVNIENLNYKSIIILLEMKSYEAIKNIINAYSKCPRVFLLAQVTGQFNVIMGIIGQSVDVLHRFINFCGPTNKEGILHSEILFVSHLKFPKYIPLNIFGNKSQECNCGNVCKDCEALIEGKCEGCGNF